MRGISGQKPSLLSWSGKGLDVYLVSLPTCCSGPLPKEEADCGMTSLKSSTDPVPESAGVLASWKGIAGYFGCNVRTAKRWEQERGLPVRRAPGKKGGTVFAYTFELERWLRAKNERKKLDSAPSGQESELLQSRTPSGVMDIPATLSVSQALVSEQRLSNRFWWQAWAAAGAVIFIILATVLWTAKDRRTARAESATMPAATPALPHVPAPGAEELYLRGRYYWNLRTADSLSKAIDAYTQAIVKDPSYAEAYAGLAETYDLLPQFGHADLGASLTRAINTADRAIALNPNLAAAHTAKAFALFYWEWDITGSDAEFRKALALDPNSALSHQWYAGILQCRSQGAEAMRQIDEAVRLEPTSPAIAADAALFHADFGDFRAGMKALREIEQTQPTLASPAQFLSVLDFATGDFPAYVEDVRRLASITHAPDDIALGEAVAQGWARDGRTGLLEARAEALKAAFDHGTETGFLLGQTLLLLGRRQDALFYFKASLDRHGVQFVAMGDYPWAKKLSGDPGYAALFAQIHLRVREAAPNHPKQAQVAFELPL